MATINIGKEMRKSSYLKNGRKTTDYHISKNGESEMKSYLEAKIETIMVTACEIAEENKRKTIMDTDIIHAWSAK